MASYPIGFRMRALSILVATSKSIFLCSITHVVCVGSQKQMIRVAAQGIIAAVQNVAGVRIGTVSKAEGNSGRHKPLLGECKAPIPVRREASLPVPTLFWSPRYNAAPESISVTLRKIVRKWSNFNRHLTNPFRPLLRAARGVQAPLRLVSFYPILWLSRHTKAI